MPQRGQKTSSLSTTFSANPESAVWIPSPTDTLISWAICGWLSWPQITRSRGSLLKALYCRFRQVHKKLNSLGQALLKLSYRIQCPSKYPGKEKYLRKSWDSQALKTGGSNQTHARRRASAFCARSATALAKVGEAFRDSGRSSFMPSRAAWARKRRSTSYRISTWSQRKPIG